MSTCSRCGSGTISALLSPGETRTTPVICADCGGSVGTVTMTPIPHFDLGAATEDELQRLRLYGACPMCGTPRDWRQHEQGDLVHLTLVQPCGHPRGPLT